MPHRFLACVLLSLTLGAGCATLKPDPAGEFDALVTEFEAFQLQHDPIRAGRKGDLEAAARWPDVSPEAVAERNRAHAAFLARLERIDAAAFEDSRQVSYAVLEYLLRSAVELGRHEPERLSFTNDSGFFSMPTYLGLGTRPRSAAEAEAWIARLESLPAYFAQEIAWLRRGLETGVVQPHYILPGVVAQIEQLAGVAPEDSVLFAPLKALPVQMPAAEQERLRAAALAHFSTNTVESTQIKNDFEAFISEQMGVVKANRDELAQPGVAGQIADGSTVRFVNGQGLEMNQAFAKSLIGGLVLDQILNNYLSPEVLDEGDNRANNTEGILEEGKGYTTMAHKWDEAYGYLYGDPSIPEANPNSVLNNSQDRLLFNYLGRLEIDSDFAGIAANTFDAFKKGRAAIVAGEYDVRDEQVEIIRENLSKVIAVRAIYYLQSGKKKLAEEKFGSAFHDLSEGFGFIYSLRFTNNPATGMPYLSREKIDGYKEQLLSGNGFWDVTPATLDRISEEIASAFGITVAQAAQ